MDFQLPDSASTEIADLLAYWNSKRRNGALPARCDLDPIEIPRLLPGFLLVEREQRGGVPWFRFRLAGTRHYEALQRELTGQYANEVFDEPGRSEILTAYEQVWTTAIPSYYVRQYARSGMAHVEIERLMLPLANDGQNVDLLCGTAVIRLLEADGQSARLGEQLALLP